MNTQLKLTELGNEELGEVNGGILQLIAIGVLGHVLYEAMANPIAHNRAFWDGYVRARN